MAGSGEYDGIITKWDEDGLIERAYRMTLYNDDADTTGNIELQIYDESGTQGISVTSSTDSIAEDTWYHITLTFNGGQAGNANDLLLYIDGQLIGGNNANASFLGLEDVNANLSVGDWDSNDSDATHTGFVGTIDELKIYRAALTPEQILIDMNQGASTVLGSTGAESSAGAGDMNSAAQSYCPPGSPAACTAPIAYWRMDERSGQTTNDISGNNYTLIFGSDGSTESTDPSWIRPGKHNYGISFDGNDDFLQTGSSVFNPNADHSVNMWIYLNDTDTDSTFISKSAGAYAVYFGSSGQITVCLDSSCANNATSTNSAVSTGVWHHLAYTNTSTTVNIYVDGIDITSDGTTGTRASNANGLYLGNYSAGTFGLNGIIDEVKIYSYARTPAQIAWDFNRGAPIGWWKLDDCSGLTAYDHSLNASGAPNGNTGTITIGATGDNTSAGTCNSGTATEAWNNGTTGQFGASLDFDGTDDYIDVSDPGTDSLFDFGNGETITITAWVKPDASITDPGTLITKGLTTGTDVYNYWAGFEATDSMAFYYSTGSGAGVHNAVTASNVIQPGVWQHVTYTYEFNSTNMTFYHNGISIPVSDPIEANTPDQDNNDLWIGADNWSGGGSVDELFDGQIDDVRIYNYALTQQQIQLIYNSGAVSFR
jgi:hypothetical protein